MKYYSSLIRLLLAILMISILSFQPYIASAEETTATGDVEVETDELEDIDYDTDDTDGVFLDISRPQHCISGREHSRWRSGAFSLYRP